MASLAGQAERGGLQIEEGDLMFGDAFGLGGVLYERMLLCPHSIKYKQG